MDAGERHVHWTLYPEFLSQAPAGTGSDQHIRLALRHRLELDYHVGEVHDARLLDGKCCMSESKTGRCRRASRYRSLEEDRGHTHASQDGHEHPESMADPFRVPEATKRLQVSREDATDEFFSDSQVIDGSKHGRKELVAAQVGIAESYLVKLTRNHVCGLDWCVGAAEVQEDVTSY